MTSASDRREIIALLDEAMAAARRKPPASFEATGPCEVWSWDITWLPGPVLGMFFYLYLIMVSAVYASLISPLFVL